MKIYCQNGKCIGYHFIRKKIKNTYIRMRQGTLQITSPKALTTKDIETYLSTHFDYLYPKLSLYRVEDDKRITLWNQSYDLVVSKGRFCYKIENKTIYAQTVGTTQQLKKRIYHIELDQKLQLMKDEIESRVKMFGIQPVNYRLRYLKSKFGSYHRGHHEITLNTFLARLEPSNLEYVLYHEYAHQKVFNHKKPFYDLLSDLMPDYKQHQKHLKSIAILD